MADMLPRQPPRDRTTPKGGVGARETGEKAARVTDGYWSFREGEM